MCEKAHDAIPGSRPGRVVVLGIGNTLLADDGAGVQAIQRLRSAMPESAAIEFVDGGTLNFTLLECIERADAVIVVDAAELDSAAGTVRTFEGDAMDRLLARGRHRSVHEAGLADVMAMARLKDCLPQRRALFTVQPQRIDWGEQLSPPVEAAMPRLCEDVRALAQRWAAC